MRTGDFSTSIRGAVHRSIINHENLDVIPRLLQRRPERTHDAPRSALNAVIPIVMRGCFVHTPGFEQSQ